MCDQASLQVLVAHAGFGMLCVVKAQGTSLSLDLLQPFGGLCHCLHHWREGGPSMYCYPVTDEDERLEQHRACCFCRNFGFWINLWAEENNWIGVSWMQKNGRSDTPSIGFMIFEWHTLKLHVTCFLVVLLFGPRVYHLLSFIVCSLGPELCLALQNKGFRLKALRMQLPLVGFRCRIKISKASSTFLRQGLPKGWWWVMLNKNDEFFICTLSF